MFKSKEKTEVEKTIEDSKSWVDYYKREIERYEKHIKEHRLKILKEELLIEELTNQEKLKKDVLMTFSEFLKHFK